MKYNFNEQLLILTYARLPYRIKYAYLIDAIKENREFDLLSFQSIENHLRKYDVEIKVRELQCCQFLERIQKEPSIKYFTFVDTIYPMLWRQIPQPPIVIFYVGNLHLLETQKVSIIGTRHESDYGHYMTEKICNICLRNHYTCISGMAKGIDSTVHEYCMLQNIPSTIAVIATGLNCTYPKENQTLQNLMMKDQLVISEYLPDQRAQKHHFIERNRLVAGLCPAIILIESASKGGSLITANYGIQYNRELFVLPGRITDYYSCGCNELIHQGAIPIYELKEFERHLQEVMIHSN